MIYHSAELWKAVMMKYGHFYPYTYLPHSTGAPHLSPSSDKDLQQIPELCWSFWGSRELLCERQVHSYQSPGLLPKA